MKNTPKKQRKTSRKKNTFSWKIHLALYSFLILSFVIYHYKSGIHYYFNSIKSFFSKENTELTSNFHDIRNIEVLKKHQNMLFGFDVSHYQERIEWNKIDSLYNQFPLDFVIIRSTMGEDGLDNRFSYNWKKCKSRFLVRGAYHYYRPDENSTKQAELFIKTVSLEPGDIVPILDIEELPKKQSMENMKKGVSNWLAIVEKHYKVKPILYSGQSYYKDFLEKEFSDYPRWIANYNTFVENIHEDWHFWQFTDKGLIEGIPTRVDLNIFQGNKHDLKKFVVP